MQTATYLAAAAAAAWGQPVPLPSAPSVQDSMHSQRQRSDASQPSAAASAADALRQSSSLAYAAAYQNAAGNSAEPKPNAPPAFASAQSGSPTDADGALPTLLPLRSASSHAVMGGHSLTSTPESPPTTACEDAERKSRNVGRGPSASEGEADCAGAGAVAGAGGAFGFGSAELPAVFR